MYSDRIQKAKILLEVLPYFRRFHGSYVVVKYGGSIMTDQKMKALFAQDIVLLKYVGMKPVIVHGGGKDISAYMEKLGKKSVFLDGLRVTDEETMEITEMVLSGKISNEVVSLINQAGGKSVGLSGKDANLFLAKKVKSSKDEDLGLVGEIETVNGEILATLTDNGYIPVISSVAGDFQGHSLNVNADHAAAKVATALQAKKLIFLTDVEGIYKEGKLISSLNLVEAKELMLHPDIKGGMIPKLQYAIEATSECVDQVHIINGGIEHSVLLELYTDKGIGTMIRRNSGDE